MMIRHRGLHEPLVPARASWNPLADLMDIGQKLQESGTVKRKEADGRYEVQVLLPGVDREDIDLTVQGDLLIWDVQKKSTDEAHRFVIQRKGYVTLDDALDDEDITADLKQGILTISIGYRETKEDAGVRRIEISEENDAISEDGEEVAHDTDDAPDDV